MKATTSTHVTGTASIEKLLEKAFAELFKKSGVTEIKMPLDAITSTIGLNREAQPDVAAVLHRMGYRLSYYMARLQYPRILEDGSILNVIFHRQYYTFQLSDLDNK